MHHLALSESAAQEVGTALRAAEPNESGVFLALRETPTRNGTRFIASNVYVPRRSEFDRAGPAILAPSAKLLSKLVSLAEREQAGLLFVHSHPDSRFPVGFSAADLEALCSLSPVMRDLLPGPFAAAVVSPHGWAASVLRNNEWEPVARITSSGRRLRLLEPGELEAEDSRDDRQVRVLGRANRWLRSLRVGLIAAGGLGSPLAETVTRMGVARLSVFDTDHIDDPSGLRRIFGARPADLFERRAKASVVARHCQELDLGVEVCASIQDVRDASALLDLLDHDILMCGTDTHSSRAALNAISYAFHLPLIDCGVVPGLGEGGLESLAGEVRLVGPGLPCLYCLGAINADVVRFENLPRSDQQRLRREGYGTGIAEIAPSIAALTVAGAGWMAAALIGAIVENGEHRSAAIVFDVLNGFAMENRSARAGRCICRLVEGKAQSGALGLRRLP